MVAFVGSRAGFMPHPGIWAYSSSKYAIAGLAESLALDAAPFGIKVTCIEPGEFRTEILESNKSKVTGNTIPAYEDTPAGTMRKYYGVVNRAQVGDPAKAAVKIVALLRGDVDIPGRTLPVRIALGDDAFEDVRQWYGQRLKENEEWEDWIRGTSFDAAAA